MPDNQSTRLAGRKYSKEDIEKFYELTLTDKQWNLPVDYCADPDPEYETTVDYSPRRFNMYYVVDSVAGHSCSKPLHFGSRRMFNDICHEAA